VYPGGSVTVPRELRDVIVLVVNRPPTYKPSEFIKFRTQCITPAPFFGEVRSRLNAFAVPGDCCAPEL
jgi:hypothetical protein